MASINKRTCECCGHVLNDREITFYSGLIPLLMDLYKYCKEKGVRNFTRKEVGHLIRNASQSARFGDLVYFSGMLYKSNKGHWGMNRERVEGFLFGKEKISSGVIIDGVTKKIIAHKEPKYLSQLLNEKVDLDEHGNFIAKYYN